MRKILVTVIMLALCFPVFSKSLYFGYLAIGTSLEDWSSFHGDPKSSDTDGEYTFLTYADKSVADYIADITAIFTKGRLTDGWYDFTQLGDMAYPESACFLDLREKISLLYGVEPVFDSLRLKASIDETITFPLKDPPYVVRWEVPEGIIVLIWSTRGIGLAYSTTDEIIKDFTGSYIDGGTLGL